MMNASDVRIVYMGTSDFACPPIRALMDAGYHICGVVTQPDKPKGRKYALQPPPVKVCAEECGIPVWQPAALKAEAFCETLDILHPDMIIVASYGKLLPPYVLQYPRCGCINIHGSLLPKYRGAAPIQRAIMEGETETGITIMHMDAGLDTGDIIEKRAIPITPDDNFETMHDKLAALGAEMLVEIIPRITDGSAKRQKQDDALASYAAKIENEDCLLDFSHSAEQLCCQIRGLSPIPLAYTKLNGKMMKITAAHPIKTETGEKAGTVVCLDNGEILVQCGTGALAITGILPEGKKRMTAAEFLNGRKIGAGDWFGC